MKLIILPGNSKSNKEWVEGAKEAFATNFEEIYRQNYSHWDTRQDTIDLNTELKRLVENIKNEDCVIFAKSAGAVLAVYGVYKNEIFPKKCVFIGFPVNWAKENNFPITKWLERCTIPTLIIQNSNDSVTSFNDLQNVFLKLKNNNVKLVQIPGDDHQYTDFDLIKKEIGNFLD